ncbi:class I SAM-dependent methyltransferase [Wenxinia saemankumensis]|uniref:Methyltransferase domain-containing protein n=1 Tax=Wenxinia saemankumensis TaxID=1447782 RepID=A0A1M6EMX0_9RHOB|nr:class I SAM-dependent methyltransferase [Wenxinia saemankumensis]SHI86897.1 Methyltransferase domain-containing protein [Wenxinia saemankumensis]
MDVQDRARIAERIEAEAQRQVQRFRKAVRGLHPRTCPICGYQGHFTAFGHPPRFDARCASCQSLERHRLLALFVQRTGFFEPHHAVLHFAPEVQTAPTIRRTVARYETADLSERRNVTHRVDIEATGLPDASYDRIICSHVLEHVDDARALAEIFRMLKPGGRALLATPVCEGWATTYENPDVTSASDRLVHFGQQDHVRYYGRDIRDRIRAAGFELSEFTAVEPDVLRYGLMRGETLFVATRPPTA